jgi:membrane-associated phospholipid phosphatase
MLNAGSDATVQFSDAANRWDWRAFWPFLALLLAAVAVLPLDTPVAQWCRHTPRHEGLRRPIEVLLRRMEAFGHASGVLAIALVVHQLDRRRRWALPRLLACALLSGLAANGVKLLVSRVRPAHADLPDEVWNTFSGWLPGIVGVGGQSFPSAHTATAVGLAAALVWLYPAGRWIFPLLAVLVGCQRIESSAHYPSDVLFGGAVGLMVSTFFLKFGLLPGWLDWFEVRWLGRPAAHFCPATAIPADEDSKSRCENSSAS